MRGVAPIALAIGLSAAASVDAVNLIARASVIDDDTFEIHGQRVRLFAIDAPESGQPCKAEGKSYRQGQKAALALADKNGASTL